MTYKLVIGPDLPGSARESLASQLEQACTGVQRAGGPGGRGRGGEDAAAAASALHDARKSLKQARSLLRLLRGALPESTYRDGMERLRDCGRAVSSLRDADALEGALGALMGLEGSGMVTAEAFEAAEFILSRRSRAVREGSRAVLKEALAELQEACEQVRVWPVEGLTEGILLEALEWSYRRGHAAARRAQAGASVEDLHELRKRVKDRWYHERLIEPLWPRLMRAQGAEAHRLSDLLGDDHDLALLRELLAGADDLAPLDELLESRRGELQAQARTLAGRLYAERPKDYRRRLEALCGVLASVEASSEPA